MTDESLNLPELPDAVEAEIRHMESDGWRHIRQYLRDYALAAIALNRRTPQPDKAGVGGDAIDAECWRMSRLWHSEDQRRRLEVNAKLRVESRSSTPPPPGAGEDRRDGERLDWLESNGTWQFYRTQRANPNEKWFDHATEGSDYSPTLRAAIDAAMRGEGNGH